MPKLKPTDFLDLNLDRIIARLLSKPASREVWKDAVSDIINGWGPRIPTRDAYLLDNLAYNMKNIKQVDPVSLAKVLCIYVENVLSRWTTHSNEQTVREMIASLPLFVEMSQAIPGVNPSEKYKVAFRGTDISTDKLNSFIKKSKSTDWKKVKVSGDPYMVYIGPLKKGFVYKPHRAVQSWSVSDTAAAGFGTSIITTGIDETFFFDPSLVGELGQYDHEKETIHFGKEPMKVALMIDYDYFNDRLIDGKIKNEDVVSEETSEIQDDEGTLTIPL